MINWRKALTRTAAHHLACDNLGGKLACGGICFGGLLSRSASASLSLVKQNGRKCVVLCETVDENY